MEHGSAERASNVQRMNKLAFFVAIRTRCIYHKYIYKHVREKNKTHIWIYIYTYIYTYGHIQYSLQSNAMYALNLCTFENICWKHINVCSYIINVCWKHINVCSQYMYIWKHMSFENICTDIHVYIRILMNIYTYM